MKQKLLIATTNAGKIKEIHHELQAAGLLETYDLIGLKDLPAGWVDAVEDRPTFVGNACKKARHFAAIGNCLTLADDSGLCVTALNDAPGVRSARYAGEPCDNAANNAKLLHEMENIPDGKRQARFVCAVALASPLADIAVMTGEVHGEILRAPRGTHGFGYDPLFFFPEFGETTAELDMATKSSISHRGKAFRRMIAWMKQNSPEK